MMIELISLTISLKYNPEYQQEGIKIESKLMSHNT
jgi:hypothetical protein